VGIIIRFHEFSTTRLSYFIDIGRYGNIHAYAIECISVRF